ncbi:hypothetical protein Hypma_006008 [Hypsizygus marmoreus]|uniref:Uncharacterized protein n=1 Tax=Hypsizygus marmoreus TaxID=39966 RepID=A0A369KDK7_HYPMA|nr:hypothetical protein Hypma_006008 [Hypsizygus marmoreus]
MAADLEQVNSFMMQVLMPTLGSANAPYFKGKQVSDFVDSLEVHADQAGIDHTQLPSHLLCYTHCMVRCIIECSPIWQGNDWVAARTYLLGLYSSNDETEVLSAEYLRLWTEKHGKYGRITFLQEVNRYFREYTQVSGNLMALNRLLQTDANLYFYRGIPEALRKKIWKKISAAN